MVDLFTLLGTLGGGINDVISQSNELVVTTNGTTKVLTLNPSGYLSTSHEAGKVENTHLASPLPPPPLAERCRACRRRSKSFEKTRSWNCEHVQMPKSFKISQMFTCCYDLLG